jgi:predicted HTH domain antitoxin
VASVKVELPSDLVVAAKLDQGNVSEEAAKLIALALFREGSVSLGRAAELCATPLAPFMDFAAAHGVPPLNYGPNHLEEDLRTADKPAFVTAILTRKVATGCYDKSTDSPP